MVNYNYNYNLNLNLNFHDFRLITNKSHNPKHNIFTIKISNKFLAKQQQIKAITTTTTHTHPVKYNKIN